jgi:hypothetical protein
MVDDLMFDQVIEPVLHGEISGLIIICFLGIHQIICDAVMDEIRQLRLGKKLPVLAKLLLTQIIQSFITAWFVTFAIISKLVSKLKS